MHTRLFFARASYLLWFLPKLLIGLVVLGVVSEGLRLTVPPLGVKLYALPFLAALKEYEGWYKVDYAICVAALFVPMVMVLWSRVLRVYLGDDTFDDEGFEAGRHRGLLAVFALCGLGADAALFYVAMTKFTWGGEGFSLTAALATVVYILILVFVTYVSVTLHKRITNLEEELADESPLAVSLARSRNGHDWLHPAAEERGAS